MKTKVKRQKKKETEVYQCQTRVQKATSDDVKGRGYRDESNHTKKTHC
jgi:hypothetical protein